MMQLRVTNPLSHWKFRVSVAALLAALGLAFLTHPARAEIRYVDLDGVTGGPCNTPVTACNKIADALDAANAGDEVRVAAGIYQEPQFTVNQAVTMTGGYNPDGPTLWNTSNFTATPTILDGQNSDRLIWITGDNVFIQNFVIRNGNATSVSNLPHNGGGILVSGATNVTLRSLTVINNIASDSDPSSTGGGIAYLSDGVLNIERSLILSNTTPAVAGSSGGGIGVRSTIAAQTAQVVIRASVIAHNSANQGGAIGISGPGVSLLTFYHSTIADNNAGAALEAIHLKEGSATTADQLQFNYQLLSGNTIGVNSDTTKNILILINGVLADPSVGTQWTGNVQPNLPIVPIRTLTFANPALGDYHLSKRSPAIDILGNTAKIDLEGRVRTYLSTANCTPLTLCPLGRGDDYGAYEYVQSSPSIRYVANEGEDNDNNCLNPDLPCRTLAAANSLTLGGDEIRLTRGVYNQVDQSCNTAILCATQGITLTGGFTLTNWITPSTNNSLTVLDGQGALRGIEIDYDAPAGASLYRNFTIRNGYTVNNGAGIAIGFKNQGPAQNLTIRNCRIQNSHSSAQGDGGGIAALAPVNLRVESCALNGNTLADGRGGGIAVLDNNGVATYTLSSLVVYNNYAGRPDANSANGGMGGVFLQGVGTLRQSEIYSNSAAFSGGGVTTGSNNAHPIINRVYIHDNQASLGGGFSIFVTGGATLQNSLLVRNAATSTVGLVTGQTGEPMIGGNAIHSPYIGLPNEPLQVINVTIADNAGVAAEAVKIEGAAAPANSRRNVFTNVLISGNQVGLRSDVNNLGNGEGFAELYKVLITSDVTTPTLDFETDRLTGVAPLNGTRGFVNAGDYHLVSGADGVDDGDTVNGIGSDLDGINRPAGPAYDIGAYETTLEKLNQTIDFDEIPNHALSDSPIPIAPAASSGLPVQLTSLDTSVCTVTATSITLVAAGTCMIRANQPGNAIYNPAPAVTRSFEIGLEVPQEELRLPQVAREDE